MTNNEAIEILNTMLEDGRYLGNGTHIPLEVLETFNKAIEALENRKTGYWEENAPEWQNVDPPYICSECGNFHLRKTNYCDQCGAKMIEQQK